TLNELMMSIEIERLNRIKAALQKVGRILKELEPISSICLFWAHLNENSDRGIEVCFDTGAPIGTASPELVHHCRLLWATDEDVRQTVNTRLTEGHIYQAAVPQGHGGHFYTPINVMRIEEELRTQLIVGYEVLKSQ